MNDMLKGKTIILGVTGSIAAYKAAALASLLVKQHADVHVIMTSNATRFVSPLTFETLTGNKCVSDTFDRHFDFEVKHVSLAKKADLVLIAPCSANVIGKIAAGICDDMLTTTVFATKAKVLLSPAMNTGMWENPILQDNLRKLSAYGYEIIAPVEGRLACGDVGTGKMPEPEQLLEHVLLETAREKDLQGKKLLITAGPTQEAIDPVRYLTNHSSGKMGYALAKAAVLRGADVVLVSGPVHLEAFAGVRKIDVVSAAEMFEAVKQYGKDRDILILCAAVADYAPAEYSPAKVKKQDGDLSLALSRTPDILQYLGENKTKGQLLVGFSMETENLIEHSREKLLRKKADMICANSISSDKTGFCVDTNQVTLITADQTVELPLCSKEETAERILKEVLTLSSRS